MLAICLFEEGRLLLLDQDLVQQ